VSPWISAKHDAERASIAVLQNLRDGLTLDFIDTSIRGSIMELEVSMATTTRRQFTDAFKSEAVRLTRESERPVAQVARELGNF
jgi:hypothetical protein